MPSTDPLTTVTRLIPPAPGLSTPAWMARTLPQAAGGWVDIPPDDWDLMLDAITARLRSHHGTHLQTMLDCADALEQLHTALRRTRARQERCAYSFFGPFDTSP